MSLISYSLDRRSRALQTYMWLLVTSSGKLIKFRRSVLKPHSTSSTKVIVLCNLYCSRMLKKCTFKGFLLGPCLHISIAKIVLDVRISTKVCPLPLSHNWIRTTCDHFKRVLRGDKARLVSSIDCQRDECQSSYLSFLLVAQLWAIKYFSSWNSNSTFELTLLGILFLQCVVFILWPDFELSFDPNLVTFGFV